MCASSSKDGLDGEDNAYDTEVEVNAPATEVEVNVPATEEKAKDCVLKKSKIVENTEHDLFEKKKKFEKEWCSIKTKICKLEIVVTKKK